MKDKKERIEQAIDAIEEVERVLQDDQPDWESVLNRLRVIQLEKDEDWWEKYCDTSSQIARGPRDGNGWSKPTPKSSGSGFRNFIRDTAKNRPGRTP